MESSKGWHQIQPAPKQAPVEWGSYLRWQAGGLRPTVLQWVQLWWGGRQLGGGTPNQGGGWFVAKTHPKMPRVPREKCPPAHIARSPHRVQGLGGNRRHRVPQFGVVGLWVRAGALWSTSVWDFREPGRSRELWSSPVWGCRVPGWGRELHKPQFGVPGCRQHRTCL